MEILSRKKQNIDKLLYEKIIDELSSHITNVIFYFQGEPFLNKDLPALINYASEKKVYTITSTNGHFIDSNIANDIVRSGLDKLIISIDGTTQGVYEEYRVGGLLNTVVQGTEHLVEAKSRMKSSKPYLVMQFLVTAKNEHQIIEAKKLPKLLGFDKVNFKTAQIYDFKNGNELIPQNSKYSRYKQQKDGTYKIKSRLRNRCWRMWTQPVITSNGDVVPCCFDKDAKYKMGNLNKDSFKQIWGSDSYKNFRKKVFADRKSIDICKNCTEGLLLTRFLSI